MTDDQHRHEMHHQPKVAVLVPVLSRPHRVRPLLESLTAATPEPFEVLFLATAGDTAEIAEVQAAAADFPQLSLHLLPPHTVGDYAKKINHGAAHSSAPFVLTAADDLHFHPGWLAAAIAEFDDPAVGVVGTQDLAPTERARTGEHATHCLVRRTYFEQLGTIDESGKVLHEGYPHEFVDDELVATAKARGAWSFAFGSIVEHLHPSWGKAPTDRLYRAQARRMVAGRSVFDRRRHLWAAPPCSPADVAIVVATFGADEWRDRAARVAVPSAHAAGAGEVVVVHGATLAAARNAGARQSSAPWLCFLDADDELEPGYLAALCSAAGELRAPAVRYVTAGEPEPEPVSLAGRNMDRLNPCVVGTLLPRDLFERAGGWWTERAWEDWSLFRRCWLLGATLVHVPEAVYRAHVNPAGRNSTIDRPQQLATEIRRAHARWLATQKA